MPKEAPNRSVELAVLLVPLFEAGALQDPGLVLDVPSLMNGQVQLTLTGEAGVSYALESSPDLRNWTSVVTNSDRAITRVMTVDAPDGESFYRASRGLLPLFAFAVAAQQRISLNGNNVAIDSFDSSDPNYSTGGLYDPAKNKDTGDVVTDDTNSLNIGSATIMGHVRTGPGASISAGPFGTVGNKSWVQGGQHGIMAGWFADDKNVTWPDVPVPFTSGYVSPSGGIIGGTNYSYVLISGKYQISGNFFGRVYVGGDAILYVTSGATVNFDTTQDRIYIAPGAKFQLYVGSAAANLPDVVNQTGDASNFIYYGLPGNTVLSLSASAPVLAGTIYAPEADFILSSSGNLDFSGACVTKSVTLNGEVQFHFDENLKRIGPFR